VGEDWSLPEVELVPCIAVVEITHLPFLSALPACTFSRSTTLGSSHQAAAVHTLDARVRGGNVLLLSDEKVMPARRSNPTASCASVAPRRAVPFVPVELQVCRLSRIKSRAARGNVHAPESGGQSW
jgi:hypothetical protein